jgi:hypothetical protein
MTEDEAVCAHCDQIIWTLDELLEEIGPVEYDKDAKKG